MRLKISRSRQGADRIRDVAAFLLIRGLFLFFIALYRAAFVVFPLVFTERSFASVLNFLCYFSLFNLYCVVSRAKFIRTGFCISVWMGGKTFKTS